MVRDREAGVSLKDIGAKWGLSIPAVCARTRKAGYVAPPMRRGPTPDEVAADRAAGMKLADIAAKHGLSVRSIAERLRAAGVPPAPDRRKSVQRPPDAEEVGRRYLAGESSEELARIYGIGTTTVFRLLAACHIQSRPPGSKTAAGKEAVRASRSGVPMDAETRGKLSVARIGWQMPEDVKARISATTRGRSKPMAWRLAQSGRMLARDPSWKAKQRQARHGWRMPEAAKRHMSKVMAQRLQSGQMRRVSKIEDAVADVLVALGVQFERQVPITVSFSDRRRNIVVDFLLPGRSVLEVYGTFWHTDPRVYPDGPKHDIQRQHAARDAAKPDVLRELGYAMAVAWEIDIRADARKATIAALATLGVQVSASAQFRSLEGGDAHA